MLSASETRSGQQISKLLRNNNMLTTNSRPVVEEANKTSPAFSRIFKEMIIVTKTDEPMRRAAKGTVLRKLTLNAYEKEITELYVVSCERENDCMLIGNERYETVEASAKESEKVEPPQSWLEGDLEPWLIKHAVDIMSSEIVDPQADLFEQGFDR